MKRSVKSLTDCASANNGAERPTVSTTDGKSSPDEMVMRFAGTVSCTAEDAIRCGAATMGHECRELMGSESGRLWSQDSWHAVGDVDPHGPTAPRWDGIRSVPSLFSTVLHTRQVAEHSAGKHGETCYRACDILLA